MHVIASTLAALSLLVACSSPSRPPTTEPTPGPGPGPGEPSHTACTSDEDCVVVETQCCDHCNGGKAEAFHKDHAAAHKPTGCEEVVCTLMACGPAKASCQAGQCTATIEQL